MELLQNDLRAYFDETLVALLGATLTRLALSLLALLVVLVLARLSLAAARRALRRAGADPSARLLIDRVVQFTFVAFAAIWVLSILGVELTALVAVLGAAALAISLSLQDLLKNLVAGLYMLIERPFTIGQQIEFKSFIGTVETIELRTTALRTATGQRVVIPNAMLFADALVNRSTYGRQLTGLRVTLPAAEATPRTADELLAAARSVTGAAGADADAAAFLESTGAETMTFRVELWANDGRATVQAAAWAIRERFPSASLTVLDDAKSLVAK